MMLTSGLRDDSVHGGEAETRAFALLLRRVERLEDVGPHLAGHAVSRVAHREDDVRTRERHLAAPGRLVGGGVVRPDGERPAVRHRVARVGGEVEQHLFDLAAVRFHGFDVFAELEHQHRVRADQAPQKPFGLADDDVQIEHDRLNHLLAAERQQLARQRRRAAAGLPDALDVVADARAGRQALEDQVRVTEDPGEQVVEVMRDAAGQPADRLHLLRMTQLVFALPKRLGRLFPFGDVVDEHRVEVVARGRPSRQRELDRNLSFVAAHHAELDRAPHPRAFTRPEVRDLIREARAVALGNQPRERHARGFALVVAEDGLRSEVPEHDFPAAVDRNNRVVR